MLGEMNVFIKSTLVTWISEMIYIPISMELCAMYIPQVRYWHVIWINFFQFRRIQGVDGIDKFWIEVGSNRHSEYCIKTTRTHSSQIEACLIYRS